MRYAVLVAVFALVAYAVGASGTVAPLIDWLLAVAVDRGAAFLAVLVA